MMNRLALLSLLVASVGCGEDPAWVGTYSVTGTWKLSGPLEGGRTVGDAAADLFLEKLAGAAPVPSFLEDDLRDWLAKGLREEIKSTVDAKVPPELAPGGSITRLLGETLTTIKLESNLTLEGDSDELEGNETFTAVEYVIRGKTHRLAASELGEGSIFAKWEGEEDGSSLGIKPHSINLRYGQLVNRIMVDLVESSELVRVNGGLESALGCPAIVGALLDGGSGLKISLLGWSHTISQGDLESLCQAAMDAALKRAAGQFELDSRVEVGGGVSWTLAAELTASGTPMCSLKSNADFGGIINVLPAAIAPRVGVSFSAQKQ